MNHDVMPEKHYALEASGLSVVLGGQKVLEIPSLQVHPNEVLVVIGPNGSGKTTLLLSLALLLKPASGTIYYDGQPVNNAAGILELRRRFAVVFQESLLLNTTVWDNVTLGLRMRGFKKDETKARAQKWLERFGVVSLARRQARMLSGGEAKRISLARAFALQPEVLFLDEPFAALDTPTRQALIEDFESVLRETRITTLMVTHEREEAMILADRVAVMMGGSIRQLGTPEDVFGSPADEEVAKLVEAGNILHGVVISQSNGLVSIDIKGQQLQAVSDLVAGSRVTVYLHYEDITIILPTAEQISSSARNQLKGTIVRMFPSGSQIKVTLDCGFTLVSVITRRSMEELGLETGREIIASFKAPAVHLIPQTARA
jgi:tungstate transport system ATP-binding protein